MYLSREVIKEDWWVRLWVEILKTSLGLRALQVDIRTGRQDLRYCHSILREAIFNR
jgi:hypothetical protein